MMIFYFLPYKETNYFSKPPPPQYIKWSIPYSYIFITNMNGHLLGKTAETSCIMIKHYTTLTQHGYNVYIIR